MGTVELKPSNHWFHFPLQAVGIFLCVYFFIHLPKSGKALLVLGGIVAVMMLMDMRPVHKGIYVLIVLGLVFIENRALDKERADSAKEQGDRRKEENDRFQSIADGLTAAIEQNQVQFNATMSGIRQSTNTFTGGKSFCYLMFAQNGSLATFVQSGDYPLSDVSARIVDIQQFNRLVANNPHPSMQEFLSADTNVQIGNLSVHAASPRPDIHLSGQPKDSFNIFFNARNGFWTQELRLQFIDGKWLTATRVTRTEIGSKRNTPEKLFERIDKGYPLNSKGEVDWQ